MKKIVFIFLTAIFLLIPTTINAQPINDEFVCIWTGLECIADRSLSRCPTGTDFSDAACRDSLTEFDCNTSGTFQCVEVEIDTDEDNDGEPDILWGYNASAGECQLISSGIYPTRAMCEQARAGAAKCNFSEYDCVPCDPLTDQECTQTLAQCNSICDRPTDSAARVAAGCEAGSGNVNTAIGCIPFTLINNTARFFLSWSLSIGGGVALLLIGLSGIMFATSSGDPDKVAGAKSLFWSSVSGLIMIILSIFLLRTIGVNILGLFS